MASFSFLRSSIVIPAALRRGTKLYDLAMGLPLVLFYVVCAAGRVHSLSASLAAWNSGSLDFIRTISILSDVSVLCVALLFVVCVLLRPPAIVQAPGLMPRIAAFAGTYLAVALLLTSPGKTAGPIIVMMSLSMVLCGTAFAAYAVFYLGRSVSLMAEARKLVTGGPYRLIRHPLYLGEQVAVAGALLQYISPFVVLVFALQVSFQLYRMSWEEKVLRAAFPEYEAYARRTCRILPGLY